MPRSIQEINKKFKAAVLNDSLFYGFLILLVAVTSFYLGRWSEIGTVVSTHSPRVVVEQPAAASAAAAPRAPSQPAVTSPETTTSQSSAVSARYVGSRNSNRFHLTTCPGASQIKEENKIYFATEEEARAAGYVPAGNCPGI